MAKRCNPNLIRLKIKTDWISNWFSEQDQFFKHLQNDFLLYRFFLYNRFFEDKLVKMRIIRFSKNIILTFLIKANNEERRSAFDLKKFVFNPFVFKSRRVFLVFYKNWLGFSNSFFIASNIAILLEKKIRFRSSTMNKIIFQNGTKNLLIDCKGRLNGVEMAKKDFIIKGSIPFQKFDIKIDFSTAIANTQKGCISVLVWSF